jgi:dolichyl-phosphate beta-glucosyltransferase
VIVVDDGSADNTASVAAECRDQAAVILKNDINRGKGFSVRRGILSATGRKVFFTDADLSTPIEEIHKCLPLLDKYDLVIGSRALDESNIIVHQPIHRELMGRAFNVIVRMVTIGGIKDTQCGFKGFRQHIAKMVFERQLLNGFGFDVEVLFIARRLGFSMVEVPIAWKNSASSRVSPVQDSLGMLADLFRVRLNSMRGLYLADLIEAPEQRIEEPVDV